MKNRKEVGLGGGALWTKQGGQNKDKNEAQLATRALGLKEHVHGETVKKIRNNN